jgi:beta-lactamase superfamily II metal-dependent hydrolase
MPQVRSFSVGNGDMYYVRHGNSNFTIIDCDLQEDRIGGMLAEISAQSKGKAVTRFISTHPDQDHISGLVTLDDHIGIRNFYCVKNGATKSIETEDFKRYRELHDSDKAFYIYKGVTRSWMNKGKDGRGSSGLSVLWPDTNDRDFHVGRSTTGSPIPPSAL